MLKRFIAIIVCIFLIANLAACQNGGTNVDSNPSSGSNLSSGDKTSSEDKTSGSDKTSSNGSSSTVVPNNNKVQNEFDYANPALYTIDTLVSMGIEQPRTSDKTIDKLEKSIEKLDGIASFVKNLLEDIQANIFAKALAHRESKTITVDSYDEFKEKIEEGGFILAHWDGTPETEEKIKEETKATIRCIPLEGDKTPGKCMVTGKPSAQRVIFARSY